MKNIIYTRTNIARHLDRLHALNPGYAVRWPRCSARPEHLIYL